QVENPRRRFGNSMAGRKHDKEPGKSASIAPPKRLALSDKTAQAVFVDTEVVLEPEVIGRSGSDAYGWARGKYYAVAPYAEDGVVSRCGKDGKEVAVRFEIRDMTAGGEGVHLSATECKKVQKSQYYFFQAVEFLLPGKFLFIFSAKSTKYPEIEPVQFSVTVKAPASLKKSSSWTSGGAGAGAGAKVKSGSRSPHGSSTSEDRNGAAAAAAAVAAAVAAAEMA
ncbi:unnamed protein product, partial [Ectocarpus sp. 12 AP-2014]